MCYNCNHDQLNTMFACSKTKTKHFRLPFLSPGGRFVIVVCAATCMTQHTITLLRPHYQHYVIRNACVFVYDYIHLVFYRK